MADIFTWTNCRADIYSYRYGTIAKDFLTLVAKPSLDALDNEVQKWNESDDPVSHFMISDLQELTSKTLTAFCLSIQSLWERQIRTYMSGCHEELKTDLSAISKRKGTDVIHSVLWGDELNAVFEHLRGIALSSFESYPALDMLQLVGNVCRHGDGPSCRRLWNEHPELWPEYGFDERFDNPSLPLHPPLADTMRISRELLTSFVEAIDLFWDDIEYIYNESIQRKAPSLEAKLVVEREKRAIRFSR